MPNLLVICGPQAVSKMTVAESIRDKTEYRLMTNHDSIEVSDRIFGTAAPAMREFNEFFRKKVFETAIKYDIDLIFTYVCAFDMPQELEYLNGLSSLFTEPGGNFYFAELMADLEAWIYRNETPHRLEMKPIKKNLEWSRKDLLETARKHRLNSNEGEFLFKNHVKIDNTFLSPDEAANIIIQKLAIKKKSNTEENE